MLGDFGVSVFIVRARAHARACVRVCVCVKMCGVGGGAIFKHIHGRVTAAADESRDAELRWIT